VECLRPVRETSCSTLPPFARDADQHADPGTKDEMTRRVRVALLKEGRAGEGSKSNMERSHIDTAWNKTLCKRFLWMVVNGYGLAVPNIVPIIKRDQIPAITQEEIDGSNRVDIRRKLS
jgi:hypothetical protein